jgi:hypothetical protein
VAIPEQAELAANIAVIHFGFWKPSLTGMRSLSRFWEDRGYSGESFGRSVSDLQCQVSLLEVGYANCLTKNHGVSRLGEFSSAAGWDLTDGFDSWRNSVMGFQLKFNLILAARFLVGPRGGGRWTGRSRQQAHLGV